MVYELMRKNKPLTVMELDMDGNFIKCGKIREEQLMPMRGAALQNPLKEWWKERSVPVEQGQVAAILKKNGIDTSEQYLTQNLGLSLTDYYWIRPLGSPMRWEHVNLFDNDFDDNLLFHEIKRPGKTASFTPNSSLQGELEKSWIIQDGKRRLLKGNRSELSSESINEVIAAAVHQRQKRVDFVRYELVKVRKKPYQYACVSDLFTSQKQELVSAWDVISSEKKPNHVSYYEHFIAVSKKHGLDENLLRSFLEYQILTDFVISNRDRHLNNVGILRDADSLIFQNPAPIFDSGKSLFVGKDISVLSRKELLSLKVNSFVTTEQKLLSLVQDKTLVDINLLPQPEEIARIYAKDPNISEKRIQFVKTAYEKKLDLLDCFQHDIALNRSNYPVSRTFGEIIADATKQTEQTSSPQVLPKPDKDVSL